MLRLTEHSDRLEFLNVCFEHGLLPGPDECEDAKVFQAGLQSNAEKTPVPGSISSGEFRHLFPLLKNFMHRLEGLNVGRILVLVFDGYVVGSLGLSSEAVGELADRLKEVLEHEGVSQDIISR